MAYNPDRLAKRYAFIRQRFTYYRKKNPKWTIVAVIDAVSDEVFLSPVMICKILKQQDPETVPSPNTIAKYTRAVLVA